MEYQNSTKWVSFNPWEQILGTLGLILTAFAVRSAFHNLLQPYAVFHFFIVAVLVVQYLFGFRMATLAMILSIALAEVYFVEPYGQISNLTQKDLIISLNFILVMVPAIFLLEKLQRTLYSRQLLNKVNQSRMMVALRRENDRLYFSKKIDHASDFVDTLLDDFEQVVFIKTHAHPPMRGPALLRELNQMGEHASWQNLISADDWADIQRPLSAPQWQSKRWERDFELKLNHPTFTKTLKGKVVNFQIQDHQVELWLSTGD
jgi:K+-sensing histidine kinase KdpD